MQNINLDDLTLGQIKQCVALLNNNVVNVSKNDIVSDLGLNSMIGKKVIIRTYSAGVWFGTLSQKCKNEVILTNARRMYQWWCKKSISLSGVALYGIKQDESKICGAVAEIWLEAIEILPCTDKSIESLETAKEVEAN